MGDDPNQIDIQRKPGSSAKWIIAGCCACVFVAAAIFAGVVLLGGGIALTAYKQTEPAAQAAREFLKHTTEGDAAGAYELCSAEFKKMYTKDDLEQEIAKHAAIYKVSDVSFLQRRMAGGRVRLVGMAVTEAGKLNCKFIVVQEGDVWRVLDVRLQSDPFPAEGD
ncbi:hypothetical protein HY251_00100 [bacterium]|nr:hypothetical protein [bacterium]